MTIQWFSKEIRLLVISGNEFKCYDAILNQITYEVMSYLYVFSERVWNMIFKDINGIGIVIVNGEMFFTNTMVKKKFLH